MTSVMTKLAMMTKILILAICEQQLLGVLRQESFRHEDIFEMRYLSRAFEAINEHNKNRERIFGGLQTALTPLCARRDFCKPLPIIPHSPASCTDLDKCEIFQGKFISCLARSLVLPSVIIASSPQLIFESRVSNTRFGSLSRKSRYLDGPEAIF